MYFSHYLCVVEYTLPSRHIFHIHLKSMIMVHHHSGHSFEYALILIIPESYIYRAVILLFTLMQVNSLFYVFHFIAFMTSTNEMETEKILFSLPSKPFVSNFKLNFIPKAVLVVSGESFFWFLEF